MSKKKTKDYKAKRKYFPYRSTFLKERVKNWISNLNKDYFIIGKEEHEFIESFRLKQTAIQKAMSWKKYYGRPVIVVTSSAYKEMCNDQKGNTSV